MTVANYGPRPLASASALTPQQVARFRTELSALPQVEPDTEHYFVPCPTGGFLYGRKVTRAANIATLGRVHKQEHLYIVAKGRIAVRGEFETVEYGAGEVVVSKPGTQRLVVSLEDAVTITLHHVSSTDMEAIERELCEDDAASNYAPGNQLKHALLQGAA